MAKANDRQVGGNHYKGEAIEHWDMVWMHKLDYFQGQITKYVMRWRDKGGIKDLEKARHFLDKYIECIGGGTEADLDAEAVEINPEPPGRYPMVKPDGWWGFTFEGTDGRGSLFTCKTCRAEVRVTPQFYPGDFHTCNPADTDPGAGYVNQDIPAGR